MPPKKATSAPKKAAAPAAHASYKDMIKEAILNLKERSGSSRQAIKKYVLANNKVNVSPPQFDSLFNRALKAGVENKDFTQPKGPSGPVKLAKKEAKPATAKPATKKAAPKTATKKAAPKKPAAKKAAPKKAAAKPKAAPAVEAKPKVLGKTKSGRVTKNTAKPAAKKAAPKKPAAKKAAPKKAAPKKKSASATPA